MTDVVRAKVEHTAITINHNGYASQLKFSTVYDQNTPEDKRFQKATPWGEIVMNVDNPAALAFFKPGKKYYVDFTEVPDGFTTN